MKLQMADIAKPADSAKPAEFGKVAGEADTSTKVGSAKPAANPVVAKAPAAVVPSVEPVAVKSAPEKPAKVEAVKAEALKAETKAKPVAAKPVPAKARPVAAKIPVAAKPLKTKTVLKSKPAASKPAPMKDTKIMATTATTEITTKIQDAVKDAAAKAKTFAEKGQAGLGEVSEFAKGNVEAMVESTKILAGGIQEMGKGYVAEAKTAFETMTADAKDLASAKTPTEFFEKQNAILKKNFDAAVAKSSKSSEAMLKLVNEAFQPLSTRMSLAMEKVKKAA
jgi:phasin family protein